MCVCVCVIGSVMSDSLQPHKIDTHVCMSVACHVQLCVTLWSVACQAPLSMGFSKTRILEWVATLSSRGSSWTRDRTHGVSCVFCIAGGFFTTKPPGRRRKWQPTPVFSCLENPRNGGAWWAAVYGVAQSRTGLKWLSSSSSSTQEAPYTHTH